MKQQKRIIAKKGIANKPYGEIQKFSVKKVMQGVLKFSRCDKKHLS